MKKILAMLLATVSMSVAADTWRAKNEAGGEIVLTKSECTEPKLKGTMLGYSYHPNGTVLWFCFTIIDSDVIAVFIDDGEVVRYEAELFSRKR